jgi:hypothetical protein
VERLDELKVKRDANPSKQTPRCFVVRNLAKSDPLLQINTTVSTIQPLVLTTLSYSLMACQTLGRPSRATLSLLLHKLPVGLRVNNRRK